MTLANQAGNYHCTSIVWALQPPGRCCDGIFLSAGERRLTLVWDAQCVSYCACAMTAPSCSFIECMVRQISWAGKVSP